MSETPKPVESAAAPVAPAENSATSDADALAAAATALESAKQTAQEIAGDIEAATAGKPADPQVVAVISDAMQMPETPATSGGAAAASGGDNPVPADASAGGPAAAQATPPSRELRRLLAIEVPVIVHLGSRRMTVAEVMRFAVGAIIEFNKSAEEELELLVNNRPIGKGQAVKVGENFGIKVSSIGSVKEMIRQLGNV